MSTTDRDPLDPRQSDGPAPDAALAGALGGGAELPIAPAASEAGGAPGTGDAPATEPGAVTSDDAGATEALAAAEAKAAAEAYAAAGSAAAAEALAESPLDESNFALEAPIRTSFADPMAAATAEDLASLSAAAHSARPIPRPLEPEQGAAASEAGSSDGTKAAPRARGRRVNLVLTRIGLFLLTLVLFAGGVALGVAAFERNRPAPQLVGDLSTGGIAAPPVVKELTDALSKNDSDSLRSAVSGDPYRLLAGEMQSWNMQGVTSVETLATMQDGPRTATEIVITGRSADGAPVVFNLVVHVKDNQIVNFR